MDGTELKIRIIRAGKKSWEISRATGIHPSRVSGILNNRIAPSREELRRIEIALLRAEGKAAKKTCPFIRIAEGLEPACSCSIGERCKPAADWCCAIQDEQAAAREQIDAWQAQHVEGLK